MLEDALLYSEFGFAIFPVAEDCKPGRLPWEGTRSGFVGVHDATREADSVEAFWRAFPKANISCACGSPSGVFVLDVDVKDSAGVGYDGLADLDQLQRRFAPLPKTWISRTPSGGEHWWFRQPERSISNRVHMRVSETDGSETKTGLDVRTGGGAAPLPPSSKPSGPYTWVRPCFGTELAEAPIWLLDIIDPPLPPRPPREAIKVQSLDRTARYVASAVNSECGRLAAMGARSGRNLQLFQAAANLGELVGAYLLSPDAASSALEMAAQQNGLWKEDGPHSVRATIKSGLNKGIANPREVTR